MEMKSFKSKIIAIAAMLVVAASAAMAAPATGEQDSSLQQQINQKIHKELVTLPYYGAFDNLAYKVEGDTVTLYGQVLNPTTRSDAARSIARIPGVSHVINNIEVLPPSPLDDQTRRQTHRAVFSSGDLSRYAMGANPSIHIIVNNGNVTLEGVVANRMDSQLAYTAASQVPYVFSVTNHLRVESDTAR